MPLTKGLLDVLLSHPCPDCGHKHEKKGSWFKTNPLHLFVLRP